jgi:hypothetical protein
VSGASDWFEIVGVVGDVVPAGREQAPVPAVYFYPDERSWSSLELVIRVKGPRRAAETAIAQSLGGVAPFFAHSELRSFDRRSREAPGSLWRELAVTAIAALLVLPLATSGILGAFGARRS